MAQLRPIRRVVTENDAQGRSKVLRDGPAPNVHQASMGSGRGHTNLWVWNDALPPITGEDDPGNLRYDFPGPPLGGHLRVVQSVGRPTDYDPAKDPDIVPDHPPKLRPPSRTWDRGGNNAYSSAMHKTETVDYGIQLFGERVLRLDDGEIAMHPGDIVVQVGAWHQWTAPREGGIMLFDMIAASFVDGPVGLAQGKDVPLRAETRSDLPAEVKLPRRIVTIDREADRGCTVSVGPAPDVRTDPARPGFANARLWVTDSAPAKIVYETLHLPHTLEPPRPGSVLRVLCLPPDAAWQGKVGANEVRAYFHAMGSPQASTYAPSAPHPYMQKTRTLDFCAVIEGEAMLVLDTQEVRMAAGDVAILRAANHAWSNRSNSPARIAIASHAAA
jgi:quercetin dioxygenase-like cupin family protein